MLLAETVNRPITPVTPRTCMMFLSVSGYNIIKCDKTATKDKFHKYDKLVAFDSRHILTFHFHWRQNGYLKWHEQIERERKRSYWLRIRSLCYITKAPIVSKSISVPISERSIAVATTEAFCRLSLKHFRSDIGKINSIRETFCWNDEDATSVSVAFCLPTLTGDAMCDKERTSREQRRKSVLAREQDNIRVPWPKDSRCTMDKRQLYSRKGSARRWYLPKSWHICQLPSAWSFWWDHRTSGHQRLSVQRQMFLNTAEKVSQSLASHGLAREKERD